MSRSTKQYRIEAASALSLIESIDRATYRNLIVPDRETVRGEIDGIRAAGLNLIRLARGNRELEEFLHRALTGRQRVVLMIKEIVAGTAYLVKRYDLDNPEFTDGKSDRIDQQSSMMQSLWVLLDILVNRIEGHRPDLIQVEEKTDRKVSEERPNDLDGKALNDLQRIQAEANASIEAFTQQMEKYLRESVAVSIGRAISSVNREANDGKEEQ